MKRMPPARAAMIVIVAALCVLSLLVIGRVVKSSSQRIKYPFELSVMEGGFVDHARRAALGKPIYLPPSVDFIPFVYTPLFYHTAALLISAGLGGFDATRAVGLLGILGAVGVAMWIVSRAAERKWLCLLVPPLVCAKYFDVACFYDQARPDNLAVLFCLVGIAALVSRSVIWTCALFAASGLLAILTSSPPQPQQRFAPLRLRPRDRLQARLGAVEPQGAHGSVRGGRRSVC